MSFFFCYLALLLWLGLRHARQGSSRLEYYVYGRRASTATVALSIVASCVGGSATIGMAGLAWQVGTPAFWWLGSGAVGLTVLSLLLARKVRESGAVTMPEMLTTYLGKPCRPLASVIIVTAWLAILAAQFSAMATIIAPLTGLNHMTALALGAAALLAYTLAGGQAAVMKSDVWQYAVLLLALLLALALATRSGGGQALARVPLEALNADFTVQTWRYYLCILGGSYVVCPMLFGRLLSARDATAARRGGLWAVLGLAGTAALIVALGIACRGLVPEATPPEQVLSVALLEHLPAWASSLILLGLFSAVISSADSCLMTAAGVCANDILRRPSVKACRVCMSILALAGLLLSLPGKGILALLLMSNDIYVCGVVGPVFAGMLLHGRATFRPWGMAGAMLGGGILGLTAALSGDSTWSFAGLGFSLLAALASGRRAAPMPAAAAAIPGK